MITRSERECAGVWCIQRAYYVRDVGKVVVAYELLLRYTVGRAIASERERERKGGEVGNGPSPCCRRWVPRPNC